MIFFLFLVPTAALECFTCHHSQRSRDIAEHLWQHPQCLSAEMFELVPGMRRNCTELEPWCMSTVINVNSFFLEIERGCTEICKPLCTSNGFGLAYGQCTRCCNSSLCNFFEGKNYLQDENNTQQRASLSSLIVVFLLIVNRMIVLKDV
ncbi:Toxin-TOLIP domain-containing protein [Aphelenchoides besseyi]|nr:Toxin-TOLIP domain-containing protein [Aphelenchoides besseyi]